MKEANFYAILPAKVRYSNELSEFEKILYCEITALASKTGECFASNKYFSDCFNKTPQHISKCINNLKKLGFIQVSFTYKTNSKEVDKRIITFDGDFTGLVKKVNTYAK